MAFIAEGIQTNIRELEGAFNKIIAFIKLNRISNEELTIQVAEEALKDITSQIVEAIHTVLEKTPPELAGDIIQNGIVLAGGGSLVRGMDTLISEKTGIPVIYAEDPLSSIVLGAGKALENIDLLSKVEYGHKISR